MSSRFLLVGMIGLTAAWGLGNVGAAEPVASSPAVTAQREAMGFHLRDRPVATSPAVTAQPGVATSPAAGPRPVIKADTLEHNFGMTWMGEPLKHSFKVTNAGDADLKITRVQPTCGCTIAGQYPSVLKPGESGEFPFSLNTQSLDGTYGKFIDIYSNDLVTPALRLKLSGQCRRYVQVTPASALYGTIAGRQPEERVLKIRNNTDKPLELTLEPQQNSQVKFTLTETKKFELTEKKPGQEFELRVTPAPAPNKPGPLSAVAVLKTNVEAQREVRVPVIGRFAPPLDVWPTVIRVLARPFVAGSSKVWPVSLQFTNYTDKPVKLLEATVDDPAIKLSTTETQAGKSYLVKVEVPVGYQPPATGRTIVLKTDNRETPEIKVPVMGEAVPPLALTRPATQAVRRENPAKKMIGQRAPSFRLKTLAGKSISDGDFKDSTATALNFVAPNCPFCRRQVPVVEKLRAEYEAKGIRFVNVNETFGKPFTDEQAAETWKSVGSNIELAPDPGNKVGEMFKAASYPTLVVVDKAGTIRYVNIGANEVNSLKAQLDGLLSGKPIPATPPPAPVSASGPARAGQAQRSPRTLIGQKAPSFSLKTLAGQSISDGDFKQSAATVLNFIAPNCIFCKRQVPAVEKVRAEYEAKGVRFINVNETLQTPFTDENAAQTWKSVGSNIELAPDPGNKVGELFQTASYPTMAVVDKTGVIRHVNLGGNEVDNLKAQLDGLLSR